MFFFSKATEPDLTHDKIDLAAFYNWTLPRHFYAVTIILLTAADCVEEYTRDR
jgi:hypothetical protein